MAIKVFLGSGDTFTASNAGMSIFGGAGTQTVLLNSAATTETLDANIERVDLSGALSTYTFNTANGLTNIMSGTTVVASFASLNQNVTLAFTDGSATLAQTGATSFTLGGQAITTTTTAAAITSTSMGTSWSTTTKSGVTGTGGGATGGTGSNLMLTAGVDLLTGTTGNDTFIADNTNTSVGYTTSVADSLTGNGGVDTLKVYVKGGDSIGIAGSGNTETLPTMSGITNLYINGASNQTKTLDISGTGVSNVTLDMASGAAGTDTVKVTNQAVTLSNVATAAAMGLQIDSAADTAANVTLSNVTTPAGSLNLDVKGAKIATLNITSSGTAANTVTTLTASGAAGGLTKVTISGSQDLTLTEAAGGTATGIATIDASASTGAVTLTLDTTTANVPAAFAYTGGSGANTLTMTEAELKALTAGSQLNGGSGTGNTLNVTAVAAGAMSTTDYTELNATKGFAQVEITSAGLPIVDASQITKFTHYQDNATGGLTINNMATNSTVDELFAGAVTHTYAAAVGSQVLTVNVSTASGGVAFNAGTIVTTGFSTLNLNSLGTGAAANTVVLTNSDNSLINVAGSNDLTVTSIAATTTGSKLDAHTFTGALTLGATSGKGDTILTGSGTSAITQKVGQTAADGITLLAGHTKAATFTTSITHSNTTADTITNFVMNQDVLKSSAGALKVGAELSASSGVIPSGNYASASAFITAAEAAISPAATGDSVIWYDSTNNNTYVAEFTTSTAATSGQAHIVELVGVHATAISLTAAANTVTIA